MNQFPIESLKIEPLSESHFVQLHKVLDAVARERRYLALVQAPSLEETIVFYKKMVSTACSHVALIDGQIVGWCDLMRQPSQVVHHIGLLGMGLLPHARNCGIGRQLLSTTISAAWARGLTRIELNVRQDNLNAQALYKSMGFELEGLKKKVFLIDGQYHNCNFMALLKLD